MLIGQRVDQYPSLKRFVVRFVRQADMPAVPVIVLASLVGVGFVALTRTIRLAGSLAPIALAMLLVLGVLGILLYQRTQKRRDPAVEEAKSTARNLTHQLSQNWMLPREGGPVLMTLDECARQWERIQAALDQPFWKRNPLPEHYVIARENVRKAADQAMTEALVAARDLVPNGAPNVDWQQLMGGVFAGRGGADPNLTAQIEPIRQIALKLQALAHEVEAAGKQEAAAVLEPDQIDLCIDNLRTIRQAEDELEQRA